jgi:hypothetical protein
LAEVPANVAKRSHFELISGILDRRGGKELRDFGTVHGKTAMRMTPQGLTNLICLRKEEEGSTKGISKHVRLYEFMEVLP